MALTNKYTWASFMIDAIASAISYGNICKIIGTLHDIVGVGGFGLAEVIKPLI